MEYLLFASFFNIWTTFKYVVLIEWEYHIFKKMASNSQK